jgi:hypothetical protein
MANKYALSNGDFNNASIWSLSATGLSATTVPGIGDDAYANSFSVQITGSVACDNVYSSTGGFVLNDNSALYANVRLSGGSAPVACVLFSGTGSATLQGNVFGSFGSLNLAQGLVRNTSSGTLNIIGNVLAQQATASYTIAVVNNVGSGSINVYGNVAQTGGTNFSGITNSSTGSVTVYGNATCSIANAFTIRNTSTGSVTVIGNAQSITNTSTGPVTIVGNVIGDFVAGSGIASTNAAANVRISGNLIGAPNGIPAVYAAAYTVNPIPSQTYIRYANNGSGVGSDAYLYHYTTDSLSAFSMPPVSAVRAGLQYANNTLTGTCQMPAASSVAFGTLVDNTTGTAALTSNNLWETSIASLTATDSLGARLKNSATVESVGRILASFTN